MRETWPLQGGVDTQGDWDQTEAVALAPEAPTSSRSLERRRPLPPRQLQARYVGWDRRLCTYVHVYPWRGRGGEKGRGGTRTEEGAGIQIRKRFRPSRDRKRSGVSWES